MKPLLLYLFLFTFPLPLLAQSNSGLTGQWKFILFKNCKTGKVTDTASVQNHATAFYYRVRLTFNDSTGKFAGVSFCNAVGGDYKIHEKNKIIVTTFGGTKKMCLYEGKFWDAFHAASSYKRENDNLYILYNNDTEEMMFVKEK